MFDADTNRSFEQLDIQDIARVGANVLFEATVEGYNESVKGHISLEPSGKSLKISGGAYIESDTTLDVNIDFSLVSKDSKNIGEVILKNARYAAAKFGNVLEVRHRVGNCSPHL